MKKGASGDYHTPVLLLEAVEALSIRPSGVYVDCTFGGGGHSREILNRLGPDGRLLAFDQDEDARVNLPSDDRLVFIPQNFRHIQRFLRLHKFNAVDGVLADLGVSSYQLDEPTRGFSTRYDAALDMRMDKGQELTAGNILNDYSDQQLQQLFSQYGEVTNAKTLAQTIVAARKISPLRTTVDFKQAVSHIVKGNPHKYFAQVFQALRIEVNDELGALKQLLEQVPLTLREGGRAAIITFHSLEDRLVKLFFRQGSFDEQHEADLFGNRNQPPLKLVTKKPITPGEEELRSNPRSRSAKLRVAEKI